MIIHYSTKVKKFSKKNIYEYEQTENFNIRNCPHCGSDDYIKWGSYKRNVVYFKNNQKCENTIEIKRIRCNNCKKTHSIIPAFLVPYKVHILEYIVETIKHKNVHSKITLTEKKYSISRQLITYWEECFNEHFSRVRTTLGKNNRIEIIRIIKEELYNFINEYYHKNKHVFMMYIDKGYSMPILKWAPT